MVSTLDVRTIRSDFPILERRVRDDKPLVYLDNAATTQKPRQVIEAMREYYRHHNANVHRSIHQLGEEATGMYEDAHHAVADFVGAHSWEEVVFTRNCTEAINLLAWAWGMRTLQPGDEVVVSLMEHHSNFVPWQQVCRERGAKLRIVPVTPEGEFDLDAYHDMLGPRTRLVTVTAMSNVLGTIPPTKEIVAAARDAGALTLVDGAQSVPHLGTRVDDLGCDFLVFSGHKMLGPTGIGILVGRRERLEALEPFNFGGEMIRRVTKEESTWADLPYKFEAGTPPVAEAVGLSAAVAYLRKVGLNAIHQHERDLTRYAFERLAEVPDLTIWGPGPDRRGGLVSIEMKGIHAHDLATLLDEAGIAIRAGHHCAQPLMEELGVASTARASFYLYNERREVDALAEAFMKAREVFGL